jgi:hypothetical protein
MEVISLFAAVAIAAIIITTPARNYFRRSRIQD